MTWFEYYDGPYQRQLQSVREVINNTLTVKPIDRLAVLNVGVIGRVGRAHSRQLWVEHTPDDTPGKENPAHSDIRGISGSATDLTDVKIRDSLALEARIEQCKI